MSTLELDIKKFNINGNFSTSIDNKAFEELNRDPFWIAKNFAIQNRKPFQQKIKRLIDFTASLLGLIALSPLFLLIATLIKLDSKGPAVFKQERVGQFGKKFFIYKFRSMEQNAEEKLESLVKYNESNNITMFKLSDDPRITKMGKFIRKYSIDELPQLFNVLMGEMSLVGPRPLPNKLEEYKSWHYLRFAKLPGLTGMWQVCGRSNIKDFDTVVSLDSRYVNDWSILLDLKLLLKTIPVVIYGKNSV